MAGKNPFTVSFGRPPVEYVSRAQNHDRVMNTFTEMPVTDQIYIISGLRHREDCAFFLIDKGFQKA